MRPSIGLTVALSLALAAAAARGQEVRLPLGEYEALLARAHPELTPPAAPVPAVLEEAVLDLRVDGEGAALREDLTVSLLAPGWQTVPLPAAGSLASLDLGGVEGFLAAGDGGAGGPVLHLRGPGRHRLRAELRLAVDRDPRATRETWHLAVPLPRAGVVTGRIEAPSGVEEILADGSTRVVRDGAGFRFAAVPGSTLALTLLGPAPAAPVERPLAYRVDSATAVRLSRTRSEAQAWLDIRVTSGHLEDLALPLPSGWDLVGVTARPAAGWEVADGRLRLTPREPISGTLSLGVTLTGAARTELEAPLLLPEGAARTHLWSKVAASGDGLLDLADPGSGTTPVPLPSELPGAFADAAGLLLEVADAARPPRFHVEWSQGVEVLSAEVGRLLVDVVAGGSGRAFYQMWLEARSSGTTTLAVTPPEGFQLISGARDGVPLAPAGEGSDLVLPLASAAEPQALYLAGLLPLPVPDSGLLEIPLPAFSAPVRHVEVRVVLPADHRYELDDPGRRGAVGPPPGRARPGAASSLSQQLAAASPGGGSEGPGLAPEPPGGIRIDAAWDALSATLRPLGLRVERGRDRKEWF